MLTLNLHVVSNISQILIQHPEINADTIYHIADIQTDTVIYH